LKNCITIMLLFVSALIQAQVQIKTDTANTTVIRSLNDDIPAIEITTEEPEHSPIRAALLSAALPGLGQAYNKKYWKIPIVWAGLGTFGYFIKWNNDLYQYYRRNLLYEVAGDPDFPNETGLDKETLRIARDQYRRSRDQLALYGILFYAVQIVDAHVDAHLNEFNVNQDLSVRFEPGYIPVGFGGAQLGMSIKLKF
jgi:Family of unknown function (DUF5683)